MSSIGPRLTRRDFVASAAASTLLAASPVNAATRPRDPRLIVILPRGAPDGGTGWLNRAVEALRDTGRARSGNLIAIGSAMPSILRGPAPTLVCAPGALQCIRPERLLEHLDEHGALRRSVVIAAPLVTGVFTSSMSFPTVAGGAGIQESALGGPGIPARASRVGNDTENGALIQNAIGQALAAPQGMRIGVMEIDEILGLDRMIATLAREMAPVWNETVVVRPDSLLVGGAVKGGRATILPGEALSPAIDPRAVYAGVLRDHFGMPMELLAQKVFPEINLGPVNALIA